MNWRRDRRVLSSKRQLTANHPLYPGKAIATYLNLFAPISQRYYVIPFAPALLALFPHIDDSIETTTGHERTISIPVDHGHRIGMFGEQLLHRLAIRDVPDE